VLPRPILTNEELAKILYVDEGDEQQQFHSFAIDGLYPVAEGGEGCAGPWTRCASGCRRPSPTAPDHRAVGPPLQRELAPIPSLLLTSAVHHHLVREQTRTRVGLVVETATPARCTTWRC
jgi:glutamate synthase (NADPH) large chain